MFKWAKNSIEAKNDIIHDTTKHLHFENIKIFESIPLNVRFKDREVNGNGDNSKNPNASSCKSILNILTTEEMETPLIKDHLKLLKRWRAEDSDANFFGGQANIAKSLTKKLQKNQIANIKQIRWSERLNALKKCYIVTKSENILPFQLTVPSGGKTGKIHNMLKKRMRWILPNKALPNPEMGGCPSYVFVQPTYYNDDLSHISGYIYLSKSAKMFLTRFNNAKKTANPMIWQNHNFNGVKGDIKVWFPTCPTDPTTPLFQRPIEEIKNELINSEELPPAHFAGLNQLYKLTDPDLKKVFRLVPLWK